MPQQWKTTIIRRTIRVILLLGIILVQVSAVASQTLLREVSTSQELWGVAWDPDSQLLAVGGSDGTRVYTSDLQESAYLAGYSETVTSVSWNDTGTYLATVGFNDNEILIWERDILTGDFSLLTTLLSNHQFVDSAVWSPDGTQLALLMLDQPPGDNRLLGTVEIWISSGSTWTLDSTINGQFAFPVASLVWSPDNTRIAGVGNGCTYTDPLQSCGAPTFVYIADVTTSEIISETHFAMLPESLSWSQTDKLAVGESEITILDSLTGNAVSTWQSSDPNDTQLLVDWHSDGRVIAAGSRKTGIVNIIDVDTGTQLASFAGPTDLTALDWSPDDIKIAVVSSTGIIQLWDMTSLPSLDEIPTPLPVG